MKFIALIIAFCLYSGLYAQDVKLISWNIANMGKTKNKEELAFMAKIIKDFDVCAIQEVVTSKHGMDAISKLTKNLNEYDTDANWQYIISPKTQGPGVEKYAFVYNSNKLSLKGEPFLTPMLTETIDREPYIATFNKDTNEFTIVNFHAVPINKNPEKEIAQLFQIHKAYEASNMIFCGDFNLDQDDVAFESLKKEAYHSSLLCHKTSLKIERDSDGNCFSKSYDNFFYEYSKFLIFTSYVINFSVNFDSLKQAKTISDHCPIVLIFNFRK